MTRYLLLAATAFAVLAPARRAAAEMAPWVYQKMQSAAAEALEVQVVSVRTAPGHETIHVDVEAKVISVHRSVSHLRPGAVIRIAYDHSTRVIAGPSPIPVLEAGHRYPAFLAQARGADYTPAAMGASFEIRR